MECGVGRYGQPQVLGRWLALKYETFEIASMLALLEKRYRIRTS